ncbi:MAG: DNA-3-methyladenine glycosylase [Ignavibacteriaceae bacterium]
MNNLEIENGIAYLSYNDERLRKIILLTGKCDLIPRKNYYHTLLKAIIGQQLSIYAAGAIYKRFINFFNSRPTPEKILNTSELDLRKLGLSNAKTKYVKDLSDKIFNKEISLRNIAAGSNSEIISQLTKVKGIGEWTVHMFLIFTLARPDVLPVKDLGLRRAIMNVYGLRKLPDEKKVYKISKVNNWSPYNSIASWYLWRSLEL